MAGGRPTDYTQHLADVLCARLAEGESLFLVATDMGFASDSAKTGVYALVDNVGAVRYIGQSKDIPSRAREHLRISNNLGDCHRHRWLRKAILEREEIQYFVLDETNDLDVAEEFWIAVCRKAGMPLTNTSDGGKSVKHLQRAKAEMPWGKEHAPIQRALINIRSVVKMHIKNGDTDKAEALEQKANKAQMVANNFRKQGKDAWIEANLKFAERMAKRVVNR